MPERIFKLQPNRTLSLRGFDGLGASAAIHSATANSFEVSGIFRDPADFAVLILYDADNFYDHPRLKYLPDFRFDGLTLSFDAQYSGLIPLDSSKYPTIAWPYLSVITKNGGSRQIRLFDSSRAVQTGGAYTKAQTELTIEDNGLKEYDRITLWYLNLNFDYLVPAVECSYVFSAQGTSTTHSVVVDGISYSYVESAGDSSADVAIGITAALAACPLVTASRGVDTIETGPPNQVNLRVRGDDGAAFEVTSQGQAHTLTGVGPGAVAAALAAQINGTDWTAAGASIPLSAEASGAVLRISAQQAGEDGNLLAMYATWKNERLRGSEDWLLFSGGSSDATWRITLDFGALGVPDIRQMWLTFAPKMSAGAFQDLEWRAVFTNWTVAGPDDVKYLQVAGPGSVRIEEDDAWCQYSGQWSPQSGFFSGGWARRAGKAGDSATVRYSCSGVHDLYLGTSLYTDSARIQVQVDGDPAMELDLYLQNEPAVNTRRRVRQSLAKGEHTVVIRIVDAGTEAHPKYFYFDFLEAAVVSDVPDPLPPQANVSPALDYSTDHTYKLPPCRILWNLDNLGFRAPLNEYIGVFWWNQRKRTGAVLPQAQISFTGQFEPMEGVFLTIGGTEIRKTVWWNEDNHTIARHFAALINATFVGVRAEAQDNVLTIESRSPKPAYAFDVAVRKTGGSTGAITITNAPEPYADSHVGLWQVDASQTPPINRGTRDWHSDLFRLCQAAGREIVVSESMELVQPPEGFGAVYPDGTIVSTDVGFGALRSTHCSFGQPMRDYQKAVFKTLADLMAEAGLVPNLQFGEFLWWFFTNRTGANPAGGMAYYDPETQAAAQAALGRPLHSFTGPNDDPGVNGGADAAFLRSRLRDHVNSIITYVRGFHPDARFELLFPYDVNYPEPAGVHNLGGKLNRFVNLPAEWESKATSNLDRIKMEALDFGAWSRNLDLARTAIQFPLQLGWPRDSVRHLVPIFRTGYPWDKEMAMASAAGIPVVNLWAFDHVCLFNLPPNPQGSGRSVRF